MKSDGWSKRIRAASVAALAALAAFLLLVALLYTVVAACSLREAAYPQEAPFDAMAVELVAYLKGKSPALSPTLFTGREIAHMADVLALFQGGGTLATVCLAIGIISLAASAAWCGWRRLGNGILAGIGIFAVLAACIGIWAAVDFEGWFVAMHEWVFTNDLWLLDPAESMLIQMLPLPFFINMVSSVALRFAAGVLALAAIALWLRRSGNKGGKP